EGPRLQVGQRAEIAFARSGLLDGIDHRRFSELDLVRLAGPRVIDSAGLLAQLGLLDHRDDVALIERSGELFVKRLVAKTDGAGVAHRQDVISAIDARPKHARHAHAARSTIGIKLAAAQVERLELGACAPYR